MNIRSLWNWLLSFLYPSKSMVLKYEDKVTKEKIQRKTIERWWR